MRMEPGSLQWCPAAGQEAAGTALSSRPHLCAVRVAEHWHRLPREAVGSPHGDLQKPPGRGAGHPALGGPAGAGGWGRGPPEGPDSLSRSVILTYAGAQFQTPQFKLETTMQMYLP